MTVDTATVLSRSETAMTVNELIDLLLEFPGHMDVVVATPTGERRAIDGILPHLSRGAPCPADRVTIIADGAEEAVEQQTTAA